jgi:GR25 family glycosyltransferase involved in LPS biosynthesis
MKAEKAYILKTPDNRSISYAKDVANSCDKVGIKWQYINWYQGHVDDAWAEIKTHIPVKKIGNKAAQCCFSGHIKMWELIAESGEAGICLEHDGMMLHKPDIDIPDNVIVTLGYKLVNPTEYDHVKAGPPTEIVDVNGKGHEGSHAYAITPKTAKTLLGEINKFGVTRPIDNQYFLVSRKTTVGIQIMSPTPAIGWIRESTIQRKSATKNYPFIDSFIEHYTNPNPKPQKRNKQQTKANPKTQNVVNQPEVTGDASKITITEHSSRKPKKVIGNRGKAARKLRG